jgi:hypothetical protein
MAFLCPGACGPPGFGVIRKPFDASAVVHTRSSSRCLPDPLIADRFRSRFPPRLLTGMTLRRFGISACTATPEDLPPSLAQHGSCCRSSTSSSLSFQDTHRTRLSDTVHRQAKVKRTGEWLNGCGPVHIDIGRRRDRAHDRGVSVDHIVDHLDDGTSASDDCTPGASRFTGTDPVHPKSDGQDQRGGCTPPDGGPAMSTMWRDAR